MNHEITRGVIHFKTEVRPPVGSRPFGGTVEALQRAAKAHPSLVEIPRAVTGIQDHEILAGLLLFDVCRSFHACLILVAIGIFLVVTVVPLRFALPGVEAHEAYGPYVMPT